MAKNQLHSVALQVKNQIVALLKQLNSEEASDLCYTLLKLLFGPNSFTHFSVKKNQDLMMEICKNINSEQITDYIENYLSGVVEKPTLNEFYEGEEG